MLHQQSADKELVDKVLAILASCDMARYASVTVSPEDIDHSLTQTEKVMTDLEGVRFD